MVLMRGVAAMWSGAYVVLWLPRIVRLIYRPIGGSMGIVHARVNMPICNARFELLSGHLIAQHGRGIVRTRAIFLQLFLTCSKCSEKSLTSSREWPIRVVYVVWPHPALFIS
jgi:hypothetical protein